MLESYSFSENEYERVQKFIEFGEEALAADDLQALLHMAVRNVTQGLDADHGKILTPTGNGDFLVVAGVGWADGVVGTAVIEGDRRSPPGFAIKSGEPVRSNDFETETRFEAPQLLVDHGIRSAINVIIKGEDKPFGVLEVDSTRIREFTKSDTAFLQGYAQLLSAAIVRVNQTEKLRSAAEENAWLLKELHHRISNDFQLVMSLINFRAKQARSDQAKSELDWVSTRIRSLAQLHDQLRKTNSSTTVELGEYLGLMCNELSHAHEMSGRSIRVDVNTDRWLIDARDAVSIGLILNEFVTNSVKHAFSDGGGTISVHLKRQSGKAVLRFSDDGNGFEPTANSTRSGLGLMQTLAKSVSTEISNGSGNGVHFEMHLKPASKRSAPSPDP